MKNLRFRQHGLIKPLNLVPVVYYYRNRSNYSFANPTSKSFNLGSTVTRSHLISFTDADAPHSKFLLVAETTRRAVKTPRTLYARITQYTFGSINFGRDYNIVLQAYDVDFRKQFSRCISMSTRRAFSCFRCINFFLIAVGCTRFSIRLYRV